MSKPHRRLNLLTGEWVLVSPQRTQRPWQGQTESIERPEAPAYDPACYLCPGNERTRGLRNPHYDRTFIFDNDFPALLPDGPEQRFDGGGLLIARSERGRCRVICFTPRHDLSIATMSVEEVAGVVDAWCVEQAVLQEMPMIRNVQIFENRGPQMGVSNLHPHCQIWANESIPNEIAKEDTTQVAFKADRGECLLCAYLAAERSGERTILENASFLVVVPFWAIWPFETLVISKRHLSNMDALMQEERRDLAQVMQSLVRMYDALFGVPFPYSMGFHQRPKSGSLEAWHFHAHYYPPLLRSATVRKFMVGYELLAGPQRDLTPEAAAASLRSVVVPQTSHPLET